MKPMLEVIDLLLELLDHGRLHLLLKQMLLVRLLKLYKVENKRGKKRRKENTHRERKSKYFPGQVGRKV